MFGNVWPAVSCSRQHYDRHHERHTTWYHDRFLPSVIRHSQWSSRGSAFTTLPFPIILGHCVTSRSSMCCQDVWWGNITFPWDDRNAATTQIRHYRQTLLGVLPLWNGNHLVTHYDTSRLLHCFQIATVNDKTFVDFYRNRIASSYYHSVSTELNWPDPSREPRQSTLSAGNCFV